jgi:hypothetical protein
MSHQRKQKSLKKQFSEATGHESYYDVIRINFGSSSNTRGGQKGFLFFSLEDIYIISNNIYILEIQKSCDYYLDVAWAG